MTVSYNQMLRAAHGRLAVRPADIPARTLGIDFWERQEPIAPLYRPRVPNPNPDVSAIVAMVLPYGPDYGAPGRGPAAPDPEAVTGTPYYGPGVGSV